MKYKLLIVFLVILGVIFLAGCAAGPNVAAGTPAVDGSVAGFWMGLWHGIISPFTFIISLFSDNVSVYEVHNNGGWYNFGFLVGASIIFGGGAKGAGARRK